MGRLLAAFATILILLLGAAFAVPAFIDWSAYRPQIEQAASGVLGRKIDILGDIDISLLPEPHFHASKVAAGNRSGETPLLTADAVDMSLSLQSLLGGRIEATNLRLIRPILALDFTRSAWEPEVVAEPSPYSLTASVNNIDIENGSLSIRAKDDGTANALSLTKINGALSAPSQGGAHRFSGRFVQAGRQVDVKFLAAVLSDGGFKISGVATDAAAKTALQLDGLLKGGADPSYNGALSVTAWAGLGPSAAPVEVQAKAAATARLGGISLDGLVLTLDPQNRPQVLSGSASADFAARSAAIELRGKALDADASTVAPVSPAGAGLTPLASPEWSDVGRRLSEVIWRNPDYNLHVSLGAEQLQLKGDLIEDVKIEGDRNTGKWIFTQAGATFPGGSVVKLAGTLTQSAGQPEFSATASLDTKNASRLARWASITLPGDLRTPVRSVSLQGAVIFTSGVAAIEGLTGNLDGAPFNASLHLDRGPVRNLQASLNCDALDLTAFQKSDTGIGSAFSPAGISSAWQSLLAQAGPLLGENDHGLDTGDIDISAGSVKTGFAEARAFAIHAKFNQDLLTVSKLSAETPEGLTLRGEGIVPLRGTEQGRFDGKIEAKSAAALLQAAAFAGYGPDDLGGRNPDAFAPAALSLAYSSDPQSAIGTAQLSGNLGPARVDGKVQLRGRLADWKTGSVTGQIGASAVDGMTLYGMLFPGTPIPPAASLVPGSVSLRVNGTPGKLETSAAIKLGLIQAQADGVGATQPSLSFNGKISASSQTPEQFASAPILALLGGEARANLRLESNLVYAPSHYTLEGFKAETPRNTVTGRLTIDVSDGTPRIDADVKADQASLPGLLSYLAPPALTVSATPPDPAAPSGIWSDRPFDLASLRDTTGKIALSARTMRLSDAVTITDAQATARFEKGHFELQRLEGKSFGGDLTASMTLDARENGASAGVRMSLSNADLALMSAPPSQPLIAGRASISLNASGQGFSPLGLISVLRGKGYIVLADGQISKLSPTAVQKSAEDLLAAQQPLTEEAISKKVSEAVQTGDFRFRRLKIPFVVHEGTVEPRRASFHGRDSTVRLEAYLDLSKMQADTTWQAGTSYDRHAKWPPIKIAISGPVRELGTSPRVVTVDEFARTILVRKMEGDLTKLEGLNKPQTALQSWTATQEAASARSRRQRGDGEAVKPAPPEPNPSAAPDFETRMRDALQSKGAPPKAQ